MARNDAEVKFRLPQETKDDWVRYAAEHDLDLSEVIRQSVEARVRSSNSYSVLPPESQVPATDFAAYDEAREQQIREVAVGTRRCQHGRQGWCPVCDR